MALVTPACSSPPFVAMRPHVAARRAGRQGRRVYRFACASLIASFAADVAVGNVGVHQGGEHKGLSSGRQWVIKLPAVAIWPRGRSANR
jgi:hypothetical protein